MGEIIFLLVCLILFLASERYEVGGDTTDPEV